MTLSGSETDGTAKTLNLTDNSKTTDPSAAPFGERYSIQVGSAGVVTDTTEHGHFYPDAGIMVLGATQMSASLPGKVAFQTAAQANAQPPCSLGHSPGRRQ